MFLNVTGAGEVVVDVERGLLAEESRVDSDMGRGRRANMIEGRHFEAMKTPRVGGI